MLSFGRCCSRRAWSIALCAALLIILSITPGLFAQSEFVEKGESATGLFGSYQTGAGFDGIALSLGFTLDGMSDCGISYGKYNGGDATVYGVYADALLVKSRYKERPVSLAVGGSFQIERYRSYPGGPVHDANILTLFSTVYADLMASSTVFFQPSFGPVWVKVLEPGADAKIGTSAGLSFCSRGSRGVDVVVNFSLMHIEKTQYAIGLGVLFGHPSE